MNNLIYLVQAVIIVLVIICITALVYKNYDQGLCEKKNGVYASSHCFKKDSLME